MALSTKRDVELALATETHAVPSGRFKDDNPLDASHDFRRLCEACRRNDLKVCKELIQKGVNINARDRFDYTPLILVSCSWWHTVPAFPISLVLSLL